MDWAIRLNLLIGVPAALALVVLATPILSTLFEHGETTARDIMMSAWAMRAYGIGLIGFMMIKILAPGYFSRQDMKTPVRIGVISMAAAQVMNLIFMWLFHRWFEMGHVGLALATALAAYINAGLLFHGLHKNGIFMFSPGWGRFLFQVVSANIAMLAVLIGLLAQWSDWSAIHWHQRVLYLGVLCVAGIVTYFAVLVLAGFRTRHLRLQA